MQRSLSEINSNDRKNVLDTVSHIRKYSQEIFLHLLSPEFNMYVDVFHLIQNPQ